MGRILASRRIHLRAAALVAAATFVISACGGGSSQSSAQASPTLGGNLVVATYGGRDGDTTMSAYFDPFAKLTGVQSQQDPVADAMVAKLQAMETAGNVTWSLIIPFHQDFDFLIKNNLLEPLPQDIHDLAVKELGAQFVTNFTIGHGISADVWVCNPAVATKCPQNAAQFWDVKNYPGRRTMNADAYLDNVMFAEEAAGVTSEKIFPLNLDLAYKKLAEIKPYINVWWTTGDQSQQIFRDKEVAMGWLWDGRAYQLPAMGVKAQISHDGSPYDFAGWAVPKGAANKDAAWAFLRAYLANPDWGATYMNVMGYGEPNPKSVARLTADKAPQMATAPDNLKTEVQIDLTTVNPIRDSLVTRWTNFLQG